MSERSGYEPERPVGDVPLTSAPVAATVPLADERDPDLAAEPVVDQGAYAQEPGTVGGEPVIDRGQDERTADPGGVTGVSAAGPGAAAGERFEDVGPSDSAVFADKPVTPEQPAFAIEDAGAPDRSAVVADDLARFGAGEGADVTDRPGPQEPGVQEGIYDQEADQAGQQRPSDGR